MSSSKRPEPQRAIVPTDAEVRPIGRPIIAGLDSAVAARWIEKRRRGYEATKNPLFAWMAYEEARNYGVPIPPWVLKYLDLVAETLHFAILDYHLPARKSRKRRDGEIQKQVCRALGFEPGGIEQALTCYLFPDSDAASREKAGAFNPLDLSKSWRDQRLSDRVRAYILNGDSSAVAIQRAARGAGVSTKTVQRALKDYPI